MKTLYLIILLGLVAWKGWLAFERGRRQWTSDMAQYRGLREYLLGNGAEARRPFVKRAFLRAVKPMAKQWRLWAIVAVVGVLIWIIF